MSLMATYEYGELLDVIAGAVPYDGPHSRYTVTDSARALYQLTRYMNNATQSGRLADATLPTASAVDEVLGGLLSALVASDQLLGQLRDVLRNGRAGEDVYDDQTPQSAVADQEALSRVVRGIGDLRVRLNQAADSAQVCRSYSVRLGNKTEDQ